MSPHSILEAAYFLKELLDKKISLCMYLKGAHCIRLVPKCDAIQMAIKVNKLVNSSGPISFFSYRPILIKADKFNFLIG